MKKNKTAFWLCLLLGWCGAHRFYSGQIGLGLLYLFTGGICGIGWIVDLIILIGTIFPFIVPIKNNVVKNNDFNSQNNTKEWWEAHQPEYKAKFLSILNISSPDVAVKGIYKITNNVTGMCYIGQSKNVYNRWMQHCRKIYGNEQEKFAIAIRQYGLTNFTFELLEHCATKDLLDEREMYWINFYNSYKNGYNSTAGNI